MKEKSGFNSVIKDLYQRIDELEAEKKNCNEELDSVKKRYQEEKQQNKEQQQLIHNQTKQINQLNEKYMKTFLPPVDRETLEFVYGYYKSTFPQRIKDLGKS